MFDRRKNATIEAFIRIYTINSTISVPSINRKNLAAYETYVTMLQSHKANITMCYVTLPFDVLTRLYFWFIETTAF